MGLWHIPGGADARLLLLARVLMSGERALVGVVVPIYLARLGYSAVKLAALFAVVAVASALLSVTIGMYSDRLGRKPFVIALPAATAVAAAVFAITDHTALLFVFAALGSFGRGGGAGSGAVGPYQPAEQAWMAGMVSDRNRPRLFGMVASASAAGGLLGAVIAASPLGAPAHALGPATPATYRLAFITAAVLALAAAAVALPVRERHPAPAVTGPVILPDAAGDDAVDDDTADAADAADAAAGHPAHAAPAETASTDSPTARSSDAAGVDADQRASAAESAPATRPSRPSARHRRLSHTAWSLVWRLWTTNITNGIAVGLFGPFVTYWFFRRFGADTTVVGVIYIVVNVVTIGTNLLTARIATRFGVVPSVVVLRSIQALLLIPLALSPTIVVAAAIYTARTGVQRIGMAVRQSFVMTVAPPHERARVSALSRLPSQGIAAAAPLFAGYLFEEVSLAAPFLLGAVFQLANALSFGWLFRRASPLFRHAERP